MLALLGPSGSGKSTLLDILAMRKSTGTLGGTVTVNGSPRVSAEFLRLSAYVPQVRDFLACQPSCCSGSQCFVCSMTCAYDVGVQCSVGMTCLPSPVNVWSIKCHRGAGCHLWMFLHIQHTLFAHTTVFVHIIPT